MHLDGARLWESQPFYGRPLAEIAGLFDTVYVSFYKELGGLGRLRAGRAEGLDPRGARLAAPAGRPALPAPTHTCSRLSSGWTSACHGCQSW